MQGAFGGSGVSWRVLEGFGRFQVEISGRFRKVLRDCEGLVGSGSFLGGGRERGKGRKERERKGGKEKEREGGSGKEQKKGS